MFFYNGDEDVLEWYKKGTGDESVDSITGAFELKLELNCNQSADVKLTKECVAAY